MRAVHFPERYIFLMTRGSKDNTHTRIRITLTRVILYTFVFESRVVASNLNLRSYVNY